METKSNIMETKLKSMETKINIMGLEVDMISNDTLISKVKEYLGNDYLDIILFATTNLIEITEADEDFKQLIMKANLILPGDETLLSLHHVDTLKMTSMVTEYQYLIQAFDSIVTEEKTMYLIARNEKEIAQFTRFVNEKYPNISIVGTFYDDLEQNEEIIVNDINSYTPDILIFLIDTPLQERFIMQNYQKINSKLGIGLGGVDLGASTRETTPSLLLNNSYFKTIYKRFLHNKSLKKIMDIRIFKKKVEHYNNKRGENKNGNNE